MNGTAAAVRHLRRARRALPVVGVICAIACILHASACKDDGTHVYEGRFYLEARDCLGTPSSLDVLEGEPSGTCAAICLVQRRAEGGRTLYVSTVCPPYPAAAEFDTTGTDPSCPRALAAFARGDTCLSDGGSTKPLPDAASD